MLALSCRVDHKSRVCVRQCFYSVPARFVGRRIDVFWAPSTSRPESSGRVVARHERAVGKGTESALSRPLSRGARTKARRAGRGHRASGSSGLGFVRTDVHERFWTAARRKLGDAAGTRALIEVLLAHRHVDHRDALLVGMERALSVGSVDPAVVLVEARRAASGGRPVPLPIGSLHLFDRPMPVAFSL